MPSALESHLELLEREAHAAPRAGQAPGALEELIALHTGLYEVMERRIGPGGLSEGHRPLVPMFRRWLDTARRLAAAAAARDDHDPGRPAAGLDELLRAMNRAKPVAEDFEHVIRLNERIARGEAGSYRALQVVVDGLRAEPQPPR